MHDFTTQTRSTTLAGPTDDAAGDRAASPGGCSTKSTSPAASACSASASRRSSDWIQDDLFTESETPTAPVERGRAAGARRATDGFSRVRTSSIPTRRRLGLGLRRGRVTVRFETADTPPGPVRTFAIDDPALSKVTTGCKRRTTNPKGTRIGRMNEERRGVYPFCGECASSSIAWRAAVTAGPMGSRFYGHQDICESCGSSVRTLYSTILWFPVSKVARYRIIPTGGRSYIGRKAIDWPIGDPSYG